MKNKISVIIPAYNEESTIADVVAISLSHPQVSEVIVVDDGSEDATALRAASAGAEVVSHLENLGKAEALISGVVQARNEYLFFIDADLTGLTHEIMDIPINAVLSGKYHMFIATIERDENTMKRIPAELQILGGTRVLSKEIWNLVPEQYRKGFQIEIALNYFAEHHGKKIGAKIIPKFSHRTKEEKHGFFYGLWKRIYMILEIIKIVAVLYLLHKTLAKVISIPTKIFNLKDK
jgi:glycosyltransferase involved in cell wall biosynthesis